MLFFPSASTDYLIDNTLNIYPNPVTDKLTIELDLIINEPAQVTISTLNGQHVFATAITSGEVLDLSTLNSGLYFIEVKTKDNLSIKKLVKQ
ncbi:MAG: T9SS type A sorting domain-containing protein [Saprospiraceae bacterium]|nr:T9SS type A sorting domain-containing protein [Saprospiraceae bacterium]